MRIIRPSVAACRNLPTIIGGRRVEKVMHDQGVLAGFTVVTGDVRTLRIISQESGWRELTPEEELAVSGEIVAKEGDTTETGLVIPTGGSITSATVEEWAASVVDRSLPLLKHELGLLDKESTTEAHVQALLDAERAGRGRAGALGAIGAFGDGIEGV